MHDQTRQATVDFLKRAMKHSGLKATPLARKAGLAPSTILNQMKDDWPGSLNSTTIGKIAAAAGIRAPDWAGLQTLALNEPDVEPYDRGQGNLIPSTTSKNLATMRINTRALELEGYMPGDVIVVDLANGHSTGDVVVAQQYDESGEAETVLRIYDKPMLTARCTTPPKPRLVDDDVVIMGRVVALHRAVSAA